MSNAKAGRIPRTGSSSNSSISSSSSKTPDDGRPGWMKAAAERLAAEEAQEAEAKRKKDAAKLEAKLARELRSAVAAADASAAASEKLVVVPDDAERITTSSKKSGTGAVHSLQTGDSLAYSWSAADDASFGDLHDADAITEGRATPRNNGSPGNRSSLGQDLGQGSLSSQKSIDRVALFTESLQAARRAQDSTAATESKDEVMPGNSAEKAVTPEDMTQSNAAISAQVEWEAGSEARSAAFTAQIEAAKKRMRASCERAAERRDKQVAEATAGVTTFFLTNDSGNGSGDAGSGSDSDSNENSERFMRPALQTKTKPFKDTNARTWSSKSAINQKQATSSGEVPFEELRAAFFRDLDQLASSVTEARESHRQTLLDYRASQAPR